MHTGVSVRTQVSQLAYRHPTAESTSTDQAWVSEWYSPTTGHRACWRGGGVCVCEFQGSAQEVQDEPKISCDVRKYSTYLKKDVNFQKDTEPT